MTSFAHIPIDKIVPHVNNVRADATASEEMVASVKEHGIVQALTVAPAGDEYTLIAGHRRLDAASRAGLTVVPAVVREDLSTDALQVEAMLVENLHRADLTPLEEAAGYEQLTMFGYKPETIASATGRSVTTVRSRLKLVTLPVTAKDRINDGQITLADAEAMASFADDPVVIKQLADAAAESSYTFQWKLQEANRKRAIAEATPKSLEKLKKDGVKLATDKQVADKYRLELAGKVDKATGKKLTAKNHADCPGHRGYVDHHTGKAAYLCTDPSKYGHIWEWEYARSSQGAPAQSDEEWSEVHRALTAEAVVDARQDFTIAALRSCDVATLRPVATALLGHTIWSGYGTFLEAPRLIWLAEALGMFTVSEDTDDEVTALTDRLVALDEESAARLFLGDILINSVQQLEDCSKWSPWHRTWGAPQARWVLGWLLDHGYQPTDVEVQVIRALRIDPALAPERDLPELAVAS